MLSRGVDEEERKAWRCGSNLTFGLDFLYT